MIDIQLHPDEYKATIAVDGSLFTEYRYGHFVCKPYLYPVLTPDQQRLTRGFPTEKFEGETDDHYWHRSIYVAHGLVNGYNLWDEHLDHGAMLQRGEPVVGVRGDSAEIDGMVDWFGPEGQRLLEERRTITIRAEGPFRILDHRSELRALYGEVVFGDTKEGGLLAIRVATTMDAAKAGRIANSEGLVYEGKGEEETWGKAAAWVDYSGPVERLGGDEVLNRWLSWVDVGISALLLGLSRKALELTAAYVTERTQFGRPVGSFQAVQQRAADAWIHTQVMEVSLWQAAWRVQQGLDSVRERAIARYWAAEGSHFVCAAAQHLHGGFGFDRDYELHRYFLAARQHEFILGGANHQLEQLGALLAEGTTGGG
jgi:hypothetical protein